MLIWALRVGTVSTLQGRDGHAGPISGRRHRLCLYHYNTCVGDDRGGARSTSMGYKKRSHPALRLITVMIATVSVLMGAHVLEVFVWSLAYSIVNAAPAGTNLVYFAFVNYVTLGYGDVTPVEGWRLLGPITAMNGALMFGWSTAVIYEVLQKTMMISFDTAVPEQPRL
jgi:hypothetical protein